MNETEKIEFEAEEEEGFSNDTPRDSVEQIF
jgi:hypothetical protein